MSNLSRQFDGADNVEEKQRRRFKRKHESGFVGNGYWFWNYPNMVGTIGAGSLITTEQEHQQLQQEQDHSGETAATSDGSGMGGTAAGFVGGLGS